MNFKERIEKAKEEERLAQIKLEENKKYETEIVSASYSKTEKTNYDCVKIILKCLDKDVEGKLITKTLVIDDKTKNPLQGSIGLSQLIKLLERFNLKIEDEKSLVLALLDLKGKRIHIEVKKTVSKDDQKVYTNYNFVE